MSKQHSDKSEALFDALSKNKSRRKRKLLITVVSIIAVLAVIAVITAGGLRQHVQENFGRNNAEVLSYEVKRGAISTTVTGSGVLAREDLEAVTVPSGVEVEEVFVKADDTVSLGDVLAKVDMASVMQAMAAIQDELNTLDQQIADARGDEVSSTVKAGVDGRVKILYAAAGSDVAGCMVTNGALAVISLDGYMAVDVQAELNRGDEVIVLCGETEYEGRVDAVGRGSSTVLITDNGPRQDEEVSVFSGDGTLLAKGKLYIHNPLSVTGFAGTVSSVGVQENARVSKSTVLFRLKDTGYSANYDTLLRQRGEKEEVLMELLTIYRDGAVLAKMDGVVSSVEFGEENAADMTGMASYVTGSTAEETADTALVTLYPDRKMSVTIGIDEADIMALEVGQEADVSVSSVSERKYPGIVTEISKMSDTSTGVTQYSAVVMLDKAKGMLPGMSAEVDVKIEGVDNAIIIPLEALHQTSAISFVYTSYDEKQQQYGGMVEITTGMQNSNFVEVTSGLAEGMTVYYTKAQDNIFLEMMGMGGGGMGDMGGGRPSGGQMPGDGRPSGGRNSGGFGG